MLQSERAAALNTCKESFSCAVTAAWNTPFTLNPDILFTSPLFLSFFFPLYAFTCGPLSALTFFLFVWSCFHPWFVVQRHTASRGDAAVSKAANAVMWASFLTSFAISAAVWMGGEKKEGVRGGGGEVGRDERKERESCSLLSFSENGVIFLPWAQ